MNRFIRDARIQSDPPPLNPLPPRAGRVFEKSPPTGGGETSGKRLLENGRKKFLDFIV